VDRYSFDVELSHLLLHAGLSRRSQPPAPPLDARDALARGVRDSHSRARQCESRRFAARIHQQDGIQVNVNGPSRLTTPCPPNWGRSRMERMGYDQPVTDRVGLMRTMRTPSHSRSRPGRPGGARRGDRRRRARRSARRCPTRPSAAARSASWRDEVLEVARVAGIRARPRHRLQPRAAAGTTPQPARLALDDAAAPAEVQVPPTLDPAVVDRHPPDLPAARADAPAPAQPTVTITPSAANETPITDAPGRRSIRLNAVLRRTSPSRACCLISLASSLPPRAAARHPATAQLAHNR
jgi:hypothetical protein